MSSTNELFNRLYKIITIIAFSFLITPIVYLLFFQMLGLSAFLAFASSISLLVIGYSLQMLFAKILKIKRKPIDLSYESSTKYFSIKDSALPITICVMISIVFFNVVTGYMKFRYETGIDDIYDRDSLFPYIIMVITAVTMIIGVVLWFYPYSRIISLRSSFVYFVIFIIIFIYTYSVQWVSTVCLLLFLLCSLIILNQNYIIKTISLTKIGVITARVRLYNMGTVLLFIGVALCVFVFVLSILVGFTIVGQFLFLVTLGALFGNQQPSTAEQLAQNAGDVAFNVGFLGMDSSNVSIHALWYLFILIIIISILLLIFIRDIRKTFKSISDFFGALMNNIISLFTDIFFFFTFDGGKDEEEDNYINYKDQEADVDITSAKIKMQEYNNKRYTYRDYSNKLNSMKTVSEKYVYAYQNLVQCWHTMDFSLRKSDTPRQIKEKISARTTIENIPSITEIFEKIHYGNIDEINEANNKIIIMNKLIRKYYD